MKNISDERIIRALQKSKGLIHRAAKSLKCDKATIYRRVKESPEVGAVLEIERGLTLDEGVSRLNLAVKKNKEWAIKTILRCLGAEYGFGSKVDGGKDGGDAPPDPNTTPPPPGEPGYNVWVIVKGPTTVEKPTALPEPPPPVE